MNVKPSAQNLIALTFLFTSISIICQAQCPDHMYALGIGGSSYLFYNDTSTGDLCNQPMPSVIDIQDVNAQCGSVAFSASGSCLQDSGNSAPPFIGRSYVENDPNCSIPQNTSPFVVKWGSCNCSYAGTFPNYALIAEDCSGSTCTPALNIPTNPIASGLYQASISIISTGSVTATNNVDFEAGTIICLDSGFNADAASNFTAKIVTCQ